MADSPLELSWDYNADDLEDTPLLARLRRKRTPSSLVGPDEVVLKRHHMELALRSMHDAYKLLATNLHDDSKGEGHTKNGWAPVWSTLCGQGTSCPNRILLWTFIIQIFLVAINSAIDLSTTSHVSHIMVVVLGFILSGLNLLIWIITFVTMVRDISDESGLVTSAVTSYISFLLVFAGLYTSTAITKDQSWLMEDDRGNGSIPGFPGLYGQFIYYSISIGTTCGSSGVVPKAWYCQMLVSVQMLLAVFLIIFMVVTISRHTCYTSCESEPGSPPESAVVYEATHSRAEYISLDSDS